jgi:hypothetical protein
MGLFIALRVLRHPSRSLISSFCRFPFDLLCLALLPFLAGVLIALLAEHVLGDPIPGRYPWSKTYVCSCGARLLSPEVAQIHIKNFNKDKAAPDSTPS